MSNIAQPKSRILAFLIDIFLGMSFYLFLIVLILSASNINSLFSSILFLLVFVFIIGPFLWFVFPLMVAKLGATPGKLLVGIRIVDGNNNFLSFKRALFRTYIGYMVSGALFWLGFIWVFKDKAKRRAWHDMMVSSIVVVENKSMFLVGLAVFTLLLILNIALPVFAFSQYSKNKGFYTSLIEEVSKLGLDDNDLKNLDLKGGRLDSLNNLDLSDKEADVKDLLKSEQPIKKDLAGFKSYKNVDDGIMLQYPADWEAQEDFMGTTVMFMSPLENQQDIFQENISLIVQDLSAQPLTLKQYTDLSLAQIKQIITNVKILKGPSPTMMAGEMGNTIVYSGKQGELDLQWKQVWIVKDDKAYLATYTASVDSFDTYAREVENVISSLNIL